MISNATHVDTSATTPTPAMANRAGDGATAGVVGAAVVVGATVSTTVTAVVEVAAVEVVCSTVVVVLAGSIVVSVGVVGTTAEVLTGLMPEVVGRNTVPGLEATIVVEAADGTDVLGTVVVVGAGAVTVRTSTAACTVRAFMALGNGRYPAGS